MPFSRITSRIDLPDGTVSVMHDLASATSNVVLASTTRVFLKYSKCTVVFRPALFGGNSAAGVEHGIGTADIYLHVRPIG